MLWATEIQSSFHSIMECTEFKGQTRILEFQVLALHRTPEGCRWGISPEAKNLTIFLKSNAPGAKHTTAASQQQNAFEFLLSSFTYPAFQAKFFEIFLMLSLFCDLHLNLLNILGIMELHHLETSIKR